MDGPTQSDSQTAPMAESNVQSPELYRVAQQTLRYGFLISAALFVSGLAALLISGEDMAETVMPIDQIPEQLMEAEPMALLDLAFLTLISTPVVTVLRLAMTFYRLGERRFAAISSVVLAILIISALVALLR
ncbi:MAG: DUF1634 domain-containing protein [Thermomicrobiales bacterium]